MITVIILTHNESKLISGLIPSLDWANSILIIDDYSEDDTEKVAKNLGAKVVKRRLNNNFAAQRNFGLSLVKKGWVLFLDPDERLSDEAATSIKEVIKHDRKHIGYSLRRTDLFLGKNLRYGETSNAWFTRLAPINSGVWEGMVHEVWQISDVRRLKGVIFHESHPNQQQLFSVVQKYAYIRSKELFDKGKLWSAFEQFVYPPAKFIYTYFIKRGFLDGRPGLLMSAAMAWHSWLVRGFLWQLPWKKQTVTESVMKHLMVMPFLLLPLGQLNRIQLSQSVAVYSFEVFMVLSTLWVLFTRKISLLRPPAQKISLSLVVFTLWLGLTVLVNGLSQEYGWQGGLYWIRWVIYVVFFWCLKINIKTLKISLSGLMRFSGYGLLVGGFIQYIFFPDMRWLYRFGWDDHYYRLIGMLFDPNFSGLMILLTGWFVYKSESGKAKWLMIAVTLIGLIATYSRISYLLAIILIFYEFMKIKTIKKLTIIPVILGLAGLTALLPKPGGEGVNLFRTYSISSRLETNYEALELVKRNPVFGVGFNNYLAATSRKLPDSIDYHPSSPDNSFMFVAATSGLVGLSIFIWMLIDIWLRLTSEWSKVSMLIIIGHSLTNNSIFYPWILLWLWLILLMEENVNQYLSGEIDA